MVGPETVEVSKDILGTFGVNGKLFLAQLFNFGIVLLVMWRWVYIPLLAAMDKRSKEIADGLSFAKRSKEELEHATRERDEVLRAARVETSAMLAESRSKADALRVEKLAEAASDIERMTTEAKRQISAEREAVFAELRKHTADLVTSVVAKTVASASETVKRDIAAHAVKELDKTA